MNENSTEEVDALCPECGHAFKVHMDRVFPDKERLEGRAATECPMCGCGNCEIGK